MNWWHYLILANLYLALFYGFYLLLLRKETYFMLNRIYLVSAAILSFFIPMIQSEWVKNLFITQKVQQTIYYIDPGFVYQVSPQANPVFTIAQLFTTVYWLVAMLLFARLFYRFFVLSKLMQQNENGRAYSFFGQIEVDDKLPQYEVVYQHEQLHAAHLHSADVLLFEVLTILNWFNPVIYLYRKSIKHNHEFMADQNAISFGVEKSDYAMLLLSQQMGVQPNQLVNSFFNQSLLKKRILMLHKNPSKRSALLKYGLSAPLFGLMLIFTSATVSKQQTIQKISDNISSDVPIREVAVDLTHQINVLPNLYSTPKLSATITQKFKGKVVSINGDPLAGVKIMYAKKSIDFITDQDGNFKISNYTEGDLLTFEYANYNTIAKSFTDVKKKLPVVVLQGNHMAGITSIIIAKSEPVSFALVEKLPSFPGGEVAFGNFLAKSIHYPKEARDQKITGRVIVSFIVEKDGKLNDIKVLRDIGGGCGPEAIRVLSVSPQWIPGTQNGKPVRVAYTMPVNFTLAGTNKVYSTSNIGVNQDSAAKGVKLNDVIIVGNARLDTTKMMGPVRADGNTLYEKALIIVDGVEVKKNNSLESINPNDIESIKVLNETYATAKYGDKGKNGAIEITLKKGKKP
ncbi:MAG: TonB family protein [Janthinobacterium lividum]